MISAECLSAISNVLVASAAIFGAWVAWRGLKTWKKQIDHDLAVSIYQAFRLRREIYHFIRHPSAPRPMLKSEEWERRVAQARDVGSIEEKLEYSRASFDVLRKQQALFDEAKLRWGIDFRERSSTLLDMEHALNGHLEDQKSAQEGTWQPSAKEQKDLDRKLRHVGDQGELKRKYDEVFQDLEKSLRKRIV